MTTLTYLGPHAAVLVAGQRVERGATADFDDAVADRLVAAGRWAATEQRRTVEQILADVDGDPARAALELAAEQERPRPRSSLIEQLTRLIDVNEQED